MFASTLEKAEEFLKSICCDNCHQPSDKLQFIGSSCKHVFCWTCVNEICDGKSFPLCPFCSLPVGMHDVTEAKFATELFQKLLSMKNHLAELDVTQADRQMMLGLVGSEQPKRTVEEFCATQQFYSSDKDENKDASQPDGSPHKSKIKEEIDESLDLAPVPNSISSLTQSQDIASTATAIATASTGTGIFEVQMTQQMRIYDRPTEFKFFEKLPDNTFSSVTPKMKKANSQNSRTTKDKSRSEESEGLGAILKPTSQSSPTSSIRRYECNLVNAAVQGTKAKLLKALEDGEDANDRDNHGFTALYHAASRGYIELCQILVENGALINAHAGDLCETALHAAVNCSAYDAVEYLLSRGANRRAYNLKGKTPVDLIKDERMKAVFEKIPQSVQIVYPSRTLKRYSVFLSPSLSDMHIKQGRSFFSELSKITTNLANATHLVVPVTGIRTVEITIEIMGAMLRGNWILSSEWLDACLKTNSIVDETKYEIEVFNRNGETIAINACAAARKNHIKMKPELFRGCQFYFCKHKYLPYRDYELKKLIALAGGVIVKREPCAEEYIQSGLQPYHALQIKDSSEKVSGLFAVYMPGQFMPRRITEQKFINLVTPLWVMDCIANFAILRPEDR